MTEVIDKTETDQHVVACDGGSTALGHPRVFLNLSAEKPVVDCPYCGHRFVLKDGGHGHGGH